MRVLFTILTILVATVITSAQEERLISGVLRSSDDGLPMPGVNIVVKGTMIGTVTDADGRYSIRAPIGSTLVFSFVGMTTREVVVGGGTVKPAVRTADSKGSKKNSIAKSSSIPRSLLQDTIPNAPGVATLSENSPTYTGTAPKDPKLISGFRRFGNRYQILTYVSPYQNTGFGLQFTSTLGVDRVTDLPALQSTFAQGQPDGGVNRWHGAHQNEIFSWGPMVKTLEYDGLAYAFDQQGMLVQAGTGNSKHANNYGANIFRTGISNANELSLALPGIHNSTVIFDAESRTRSGIIPNSSYKKFNASVNLKNFQWKKLRLSSTLSFNDSRGTLLTRGANMANIIGSIYRTPLTFDNANGLSLRQARTSSGAYLLEDGNVRSHAPGLADNPLGLINDLPDQDELQRFIGLFNLRYQINKDFDVSIYANTDRQVSENVFGIPTNYAGYPAGRMTAREELQWLSTLTIAPTYEVDIDGLLLLGVVWQSQLDYRELNRNDGFSFQNNLDISEADILLHTGRDLSRSTHEILLKAEYVRNWLQVKLSSRSYFSNTVSSKDYTNLLPAAGISADLAELLYLDAINSLRVYASYSRSLREASLLYSNWSHLSTRTSLDQYNSFYEDRELFFNSDLVPETERKFETGFKLATNHVSLDFAYFNNYTDDFVAPVYDDGNFRLGNVAAIKNYGSTISLDINGRIPDGNLSTQLRWTKSYSQVMDVYGGNEIVPMAGFASIQSVLTAGQPVGAIYGTTYRKNFADQTIIGADGFPIEEQQLKKIGDPIPDWVLGWGVQANMKSFGLSFLFDFKRGGDVWNGTQAVMDYLGRSATTAELRQTAGFVFDGVDQNNNPNTIPVTFADPAEPLSANRWVRYGWDGVGEDYIEDASWIRLSEVNLSYSLKRHVSRKTSIKEIKVNLIGRNLFLITPYSGVDPSSSLFGYATGSGLDLFNMPSVRSYSLQLTFKI